MIAPSEFHLSWGRRLPMTLQTEAAECGLACLAMIAGFLGREVEIAALRRRFGLSLKGATMRDLIGIADQIGLASRPLRLEMDELPMLRMPCVLHWDMNHFVVLKSVTRGVAVIHDPAVGVRRIPLGQMSKHFTGVALEFVATVAFEPATAAPRVRMRQMIGNVVGLKASLVRLLCLALAMEAFAMVSPLFLVWVLDHAIVSGDRDLLLTLALGFALLLVLQSAVSAMRGWMLIALGASLKVQARANLFSHLMNLPASYFETRQMGDVLARFGSQETILQALTTETVVAVLDGLMCLVTLALMFAFAPLLAAVALGSGVLYAMLRVVSYMPLRQASMEAIIWGARRDTHFLETLRGIKTIKLFNAYEDRRARWLNLLVETVNRQIATQKLSLLFNTANMLLLGGLSIFVVWIGARSVLDNAFSVGMLVAFIAYKDQFIHRLSEFVNRLVELRMLRLHAERLADIALSEPEVRGWAGPSDVRHEPVCIEAKDLRFRYGVTDPWVLDGVSFRIDAGESVAVTGGSGCGKTTLLKLMSGLLQPTSGEILVNGEPLTRLGLDRYRAMIGVVMQDDQLFAGSIADNIGFFSGQPDQARIETCARMAAAHDDIVAMPMGYGSLIGDMGTTLSGGQKQRVLIARALYREPGLLLLDEATSHLDVDRERQVNQALRLVSTTRVVIAHRPETIRASDRVIRLERGRLVPAADGLSAAGLTWTSGLVEAPQRSEERNGARR